MEQNVEYHDPDYAGTAVGVKTEKETEPEEDRIRKIRNILQREFAKELEERENEVGLIAKRMQTARHLLHRLRCSVVTRYYCNSKLQLSGGQIQDEVAAQHEPWDKAQTASLLRDGQRRIHPSVRKLLGRQQVDLDEIFKHRPPRNSTRKDYSAMVQTRNYTIAADKTRTLRPDACPTTGEPNAELEPSAGPVLKHKKVPRRIDPKLENVLTLDDATRNRQKHRFRIIIGNTSKYAAPASRADRSTHKWLLYVRAAGGSLRHVVSAVTVTLHHSYAPHHHLHIDKPPYHVSRRGWGEFPARVELHFALPHRNRPATVEHTIKLDRNYTGLQTLGAETVVDVWLYCDEEMLKYEFHEEPAPNLEIKEDKQEEIPAEEIPQPEAEEADPNKQLDSWFEFFNKEDTELDVDEMIIKAVKKDEQTPTPAVVEPETEPLNNAVIKQEIIEEQMEKNVIVNADSINVFEPQDVKTEIETEMDYQVDTQENLLDDSMPTELINQATSVKKRIMKYMDPTTGRIYYLEMDRNLDLTKVQEIVINSKGNTKTAKISPIKTNGLKNVRKTPKKGISLLRPEVTSKLKPELTQTAESPHKPNLNYKHIGNDHCYLGTAWSKTVKFQASAEKSKKVLPETRPRHNSDVATVKHEAELKKEKEMCLYDQLCNAVKRFSCERIAVNYLLSKIPLCGHKDKGGYFKNLPFVAASEDAYWKMDFAKRRNIEWSRAKTISKILAQHSNLNPTWRTKQILLFSRLHGYHPVREEKLTASINADSNEQWSSWNDLENTRKIESTIKEIFPNPSDINSLTLFRQDDYLTENTVADFVDMTSGEEEVEVVCDSPVRVKREVLPECSDSLEVLPVESEEDRLRFMFLERKCMDIGIELRNEDVGNGFSYSAIHAVLLTAMRRFAEDLIRESLATRRSEGLTQHDAPLPVWTSPEDTFRPTITLQHLWGALRRGRGTVSGAGRGVEPHKDCPL